MPLAPTLIGENGDDTISEEGKLLACVRDDNVTYASTSQRDLIPPGDYEDPSPLLTPEPLGDGETERLVRPGNSMQTSGASNAAVNVTVHTTQQVIHDEFKVKDQFKDVDSRYFNFGCHAKGFAV